VAASCCAVVGRGEALETGPQVDTNGPPNACRILAAHDSSRATRDARPGLRPPRGARGDPAIHFNPGESGQPQMDI
jgi:hypothetical protein